MSNGSIRRNDGEQPRISTEQGGAWNSETGQVSSRHKKNTACLLVALMVSVTGFTMTPSMAFAEESNPCGNIDVSAEANCSASVDVSCTAQCTPASFNVTCDANCSDTTCTEIETTECSQECNTWCNTECETDPGSFSCEASCSSNCETSCPGKCHDHPSQGQCENSCRTSCGTECSASCTVVAPTETCETQCNTCCDTSCTVQHNVVCEVGCAVECSVEMQGGCETRCGDPEGAIFCDGQFVDTGNNMDECIDYLESIDVTVDISAWATVNADIDGGFSCTAVPGKSNASGTTAAFGGLTLLGLMFLRRRSLR